MTKVVLCLPVLGRQQTSCNVLVGTIISYTFVIFFKHLFAFALSVSNGKTHFKDFAFS